MGRLSNQDDYFACPHCGADLAVDATFCRACGASDEMGWSGDWDEDEATGYSYESDFDYDEYVAREHRPTRTLKKFVVAAIIVAICAAILLLQLGIGW